MTRATGEEYVVRRKRSLVHADDGEPLMLETQRDVTLERAVHESEGPLPPSSPKRARATLISRTDSERAVHLPLAIVPRRAWLRA